MSLLDWPNDFAASAVFGRAADDVEENILRSIDAWHIDHRPHLKTSKRSSVCVLLSLRTADYECQVMGLRSLYEDPDDDWPLLLTAGLNRIVLKHSGPAP